MSTAYFRMGERYGKTGNLLFCPSCSLQILIIDTSYDMDFIKEKIEVLTDRLRILSRESVGGVGATEYVKIDYKQGHTPPTKGWKPFEKGTRAFFRTSEAILYKNPYLQIYTRYDEWR